MCKHTDFEVLKKRGRQELRKCNTCGEVFHNVIDKEIPIKITAVISYFENSKKIQLDTVENKIFQIGELLEVNKKKYFVNHIDAKRKGELAAAKDIHTLYLIPEDIPTVLKITLKMENGHLSFRAFSDREEIFSKGDNISLEGYDMIIEKILASNGYKPSAQASEIRRIYCSLSTKRGRSLHVDKR
ncbi:MAG: hypothetical protein APG08_01112 [Candidatus Methanofastidiosum methylothiophilum]|uniref:Archaeal Zn-finger protein n=1 Tax=Candidatus Methanofastidiosum methylothiophilum TaxID=1705564 RepID=A0A150JBL3_9EURY|nr:MAG: hypothetical protein AN188_00887 [Candidatus Methanofastidiosum methylthiophilus]OQC51011.1 MAG: hypothetical protein BWX56_01172 [Euryarchaeota archaeon ADurb.Bin023]HNV93919.1 HVO_0476 family zinc finger protein [Methanofastidiosum sp.]KYC56157.1 MAG: hypothetical protein APG08_01112 [Candidatus Methanofastidiosum methylthiophilus]KYC57205.1 MAG: hypothetical protein APG09_01130 [Candidatus Methanofastidiosum methylthiophilus]